MERPLSSLCQKNFYRPFMIQVVCSLISQGIDWPPLMPGETKNVAGISSKVIRTSSINAALSTSSSQRSHMVRARNTGSQLEYVSFFLTSNTGVSHLNNPFCAIIESGSSQINSGRTGGLIKVSVVMFLTVAPGPGVIPSVEILTSSIVPFGVASFTSNGSVHPVFHGVSSVL